MFIISLMLNGQYWLCRRWLFIQLPVEEKRLLFVFYRIFASHLSIAKEREDKDEASKENISNSKGPLCSE